MEIDGLAGLDKEFPFGWDSEKKKAKRVTNAYVPGITPLILLKGKMPKCSVDFFKKYVFWSKWQKLNTALPWTLLEFQNWKHPDADVFTSFIKEHS